MYERDLLISDVAMRDMSVRLSPLTAEGRGLFGRCYDGDIK